MGLIRAGPMKVMTPIERWKMTRELLSPKMTESNQRKKISQRLTRSRHFANQSGKTEIPLISVLRGIIPQIRVVYKHHSNVFPLSLVVTADRDRAAGPTRWKAEKIEKQRGRRQEGG